MKRLIVGISGASGAIYGVRLLQILRDVDSVETHLVMSQAARQTLALETHFFAARGAGAGRCDARCARHCRQHFLGLLPDGGNGYLALFD
ncbi:decarboxylase [Salmonella enterica subsp. enterica]|nr:decarboxylase [Salmonella enterica subsp. enterica]